MYAAKTYRRRRGTWIMPRHIVTLYRTDSIASPAAVGELEVSRCCSSGAFKTRPFLFRPTTSDRAMSSGDTHRTVRWRWKRSQRTVISKRQKQKGKSTNTMHSAIPFTFVLRTRIPSLNCEFFGVFL